jgi:o-succinylbenzoate---CoA ligase
MRTMRHPSAVSLLRMASHPRLRVLDDRSESLGDDLDAAWKAGDAACIGSVGGSIDSAVRAVQASGGALPHGTALVVPTSGTSGPPRIVLLSHDALAASTASSISALGCTPGERWALALPVRHIAGLQVLARARALGTQPYVIEDTGDPDAIAAASHHAEHIALVPTQLVRCLSAGVDLRGFRSVLVGGGPLAATRAAEARASGVALVLSYGMTETCGGCVYDGRPLPGVDVALDDEGRIRLRGPMLASGYLDASPGESARFTPDGWFLTDDLGRLTGGTAGRESLEVIGRRDDVIISGGVKIAPGLVEQVIRGLVGIHDAVIVGVPDAEWGQRVRAAIVPAADAPVPVLEALRDAVASVLPATHAPREMVLVDEIRRDALGKLSAAERERLAAYSPA